MTSRRTTIASGNPEIRTICACGASLRFVWTFFYLEVNGLNGLCIAQWPDEADLPGFKATMNQYLNQVQALSYKFAQLISRAFGLEPSALSRFYDTAERMQHRSKIVKYPPRDTVSSSQGVGPHFDAGFLTFLLQASPHPGLQVQNLRGDWIDAPPVPDTFVINIGKGLEAVTQGMAKATSHRVLSPPAGSTPRYSIPFFQNISQTVKLAENILQCE